VNRKSGKTSHRLLMSAALGSHAARDAYRRKPTKHVVVCEGTRTLAAFANQTTLVDLYRFETAAVGVSFE